MSSATGASRHVWVPPGPGLDKCLVQLRLTLFSAVSAGLASGDHRIFLATAPAAPASRSTRAAHARAHPPPGRQGHHHPARTAHGTRDRPGHRRAHGRPGVPDRRRAAAGPAQRRVDRPQGRPPRRDHQDRHAPHAAARVHHRRASLDAGVPPRAGPSGWPGPGCGTRRGCVAAASAARRSAVRPVKVISL